MGWNGSETDGLRRPHRTENANCVAGERHKPQTKENPDCAAGERYNPYGAGNQDCAATGTPRERRGPHGAGPVPKADSCRRRRAWRGVFAGLLVAALGAIVSILVVRPGGDGRPASAAGAPPAPAAIADGGTNAVRVAAPTGTQAEAPGPDARPTRAGETVNGYVKLPSGRIHRVTGVVTNAIANRPRARYEIFERRCDNEIAGYLSMEPGDVIVGTPRYGGRFRRDFVESLDEPIVVGEGDTPEQAQLKRDVIEARAMLKEAMDRGEDVEQIMLDTRQELQEMMRAKQELKRLFYEERMKCETEEDVESVLGACNRLLEQRGIAPLVYGPVTRRLLVRRRAEGAD